MTDCFETAGLSMGGLPGHVALTTTSGKRKGMRTIKVGLVNTPNRRVVLAGYVAGGSSRETYYMQAFFIKLKSALGAALGLLTFVVFLLLDRGYARVSPSIVDVAKGIMPSSQLSTSCFVRFADVGNTAGADDAGFCVSDAGAGATIGASGVAGFDAAVPTIMINGNSANSLIDRIFILLSSAPRHHVP